MLHKSFQKHPCSFAVFGLVLKDPGSMTISVVLGYQERFVPNLPGTAAVWLHAVEGRLEA